MNERVAVYGIMLLLLLVMASPAEAGWRWCARDPVVRLNGTQVQIVVSIPEEYLTAVNGPVQVDINVNQGVTTELISTDDGFGGYGEIVRFRVSKSDDDDDASEVVIRVSVPVAPATTAAEDGANLAAVDMGDVQSNDTGAADNDGVELPLRVEVIPENGTPVTAIGEHGRVKVKLRIVGSPA